MSGKSKVTTATKRIKKEMLDLAKEDLGEITLSPNEANIFAWKATLPGPKGSPYEGGVFEVDIRIPEDYPFQPPRLLFLTKVYHCNIAPSGAICLDLLKHAWSPALSLYKVILSLSSLLTDPNPSDPLVPAIAQEYKSNRKKHDEKAREQTKKHALPKAKAPPPAPVTLPPRVRAAPRPAAPTSGPSAASSVPPVTGRRRRPETEEAIDLVDSDEEADLSSIEILTEDPRATHQAGGGSNGQQQVKEPARKKVRPESTGDLDVIVIED